MSARGAIFAFAGKRTENIHPPCRCDGRLSALREAGAQTQQITDIFCNTCGTHLLSEALANQMAKKEKSSRWHIFQDAADEVIERSATTSGFVKVYRCRPMMVARRTVATLNVAAGDASGFASIPIIYAGDKGDR